MSDNSKFDELRSKVAKEMQNESQESGRVNASLETRKRAMSRWTAYNRVLQIMDEIQKPSPEQAVVIDCPDCGGGDERCLCCDGTGTVIE